MRRILPLLGGRFSLFFILGAGVTLLAGAYSEFHASSNDFWSLIFYGRNMNWAHKGSLYNGYYPVGYAFLIGQLPYTYVVQLAYALNALLAGLFVASVASLIATRKNLPALWFALIISIAEPLTFYYANTPGPDIGAAAFPAFAIYLLWKKTFAEEDADASNLLPILVGASLALGFLWRAHVIVLAVIILALAIAFRLLPSRSANLKMIAAFLALTCLQIAANVISGHKPFETAQAFNIYKLFYGMNWTHPPAPEEIKKFSLLSLIFSDPLFVGKTILPYLKYLLSFSLPSIAGALLAPSGALKKFTFFSFLTIALYAFPLSFSDSPRAPLPILSLYALSLALLFMILTEKIRGWIPSARWAYPIAVFTLAVLSAFPAYGWIQSDWEYISKNRASHRGFLAVERVLLSHGMQSPDEVFSNKYHLYMPSQIPYLPRQFADWFADWFWGFSEVYPSIPNDSWESFRNACIEQGVRYLVLSPNAGAQGDFFSAIYENNFDPEQMGVEFVAERVNMRIYQFIR